MFMRVSAKLVAWHQVLAEDLLEFMIVLIWDYFESCWALVLVVRLRAVVLKLIRVQFFLEILLFDPLFCVI